MHTHLPAARLISAMRSRCCSVKVAAFVFTAVTGGLDDMLIVPYPSCEVMDCARSRAGGMRRSPSEAWRDCQTMCRKGDSSHRRSGRGGCYGTLTSPRSFAAGLYEAKHGK